MKKQNIDMPKAIIMVNYDEEDRSRYDSGMYVKWDFIRKLYARFNKGDGSKELASMYAEISNAVISKCQRLLNKGVGEKFGAIEPTKMDGSKELQIELESKKKEYSNLYNAYKILKDENKKLRKENDDLTAQYKDLKKYLFTYGEPDMEITLNDLQIATKALEDLKRLNYHLEVYFDTANHQWIAGVIMVDGNNNSVLVDVRKGDMLPNVIKMIYEALEKKMDNSKVVDE